MADDGSRTEDERDPVEALVFECLEARADHGPEAVEALLRSRPELAEAARSELAKLEGLGLLGTERAAGEPGVPERLGDFEIVRVIGQGGMGVVYEAMQLSLGRPVALKVVRPELLFFEDPRRRFQREVTAVARMQHPGIVPVYTVGEEQGIPYIAMELLDGATLADVLGELRSENRVTLRGNDLARALARAAPAVEQEVSGGASFDGSWVDVCTRIVRDVAEALEHVHSRGIVHRDVKPSNVAITRAGRAMLFDFGLALGDEGQRLTRSGSRPGSLSYMSPEQLAGDRDLDGRTDVWSLGVTFYELLTLRQPFEAGSFEATYQRIVGGRPEPPRGLPADLQTVVLAALERDPAWRYATAGDFARDLGNLLARRPIEARRPGTALRLLRWGQRHPRSSAALLVALPLALVALGAVGWIQAEGRRTEAELRAGAEREHAQVLRLSDQMRLDQLVAEADTLFPSRPERIGNLRAWLTRTGDLEERLGLHRSSLAELEAVAVVGEDGVLAFETTEEEWQHANLSRLIAELNAVSESETGLVADVRERLRWAGTVEEATLSGEEARARWSAALAAIADPGVCPAYEGLTLTPQLGLLPLGRDPFSGLWEFLHVQSGVEPLRGEDGRLRLDERTGLVFVLVPGGTALLGAQREDPGGLHFDPRAHPQEVPLQEVELEPFFLAKYEVTQAQWERLVGETPSLFKPPGFAHEENRPVESVSWEECHDFVRRMDLTLPTSAQWEHAARAWTSTAWWTGQDMESLRGRANLADLSAVRGEAPFAGLCDDPGRDDGYAQSSPVNAFPPNPFGLHDMIGNVWEWCLDNVHPRGTPLRPGDGACLDTTDPYKALRGGAFSAGSVGGRSGGWSKAPPTLRSMDAGLRPARRVER